MALFAAGRSGRFHAPTAKLPPARVFFARRAGPVFSRFPGAAGDGGSVSAADFQHTAADRAKSKDCNFSHKIPLPS